MVQINFAQKQVNAKVVYYGPGMSGKTTNLEIVHQRAPTPNRGDLTSISTDGDRTLFFDFMPLDLGTVAGMRTCFQLYTVPGQVYYNSTRKLVLQGVDGVVFVADSSASMVEENLESMRNLEQNLAEYGKSLASMPLIIQYNKRDLPDALPVDELNRLLNPYGAPCFEAIANSGQGVFPTLKALAARVLESIHTGNRPSAPAAGIQAGLSQTGFHPAPAAGGTPGAAPRTLQQTGYNQVPSMPMQGAPQHAQQHAMQGQPMQGQPIPMQPMAMQPGQAPGMMPQQAYPESLARTTVHAPPMQGGHPGMQPGMQSIAMGGQAMSGQPGQHPQMQGHAPMQPQMGHPMHPQQPGMMHPQMQVPPAIPQQHGQMQQQQQLHQTGYGYAPQGQGGMQPGMQPMGMPMQQAMPAATMAPQQAQPQGSLHMLRVDKGQSAAVPAQKPRAVAAPKPAAAKPAAKQPAQNTAPAPVEAGPRIQPRNQPMATPGSGKKRLVYAAVFVVIALGVGAFVAKMVLSVL
jgi:signal recognition particle receptor subunit beta